MDVHSDPTSGISIPSTNPVFGVSNQTKDRKLSTSEDKYNLIDLPATAITTNDQRFTGSAQEEHQNVGLCKASLVIWITLSTGVLALVVAMASVGLSTALNSNPKIQSLAAAVDTLQLSLNQSMNDIEDLVSQISTLQTNGATQHGFLNQSVRSILNTIREHSDLLNELKSKDSYTIPATLNQSLNGIEVLVQNITVLQTDTVIQYGILNTTVNSIQDTIHEHSDILNKLNAKGSITNPATSCSEIPTDRPSGEYWILENSSSVQVYCDMNQRCCNTTGGWMKVANLDMTDSNQQCPAGFQLHSETRAPLRTCGRPGPPGCVSATFPVHGVEYSRVCGRVIGYQYRTADAFRPYYNNRALNINDNYVEGVSLTHGQSPRKHIWTFACAVDEVDIRGRYTCPCIRPDITYTGVVPPFIGQDYFCDTGSRRNFQFIFYPNDPLWNGHGCGGTSTCCSFNNPPWFCKQLPQPTTDDIELRLCADQTTSNEDALLELVDIFVK